MIRENAAVMAVSLGDDSGDRIMDARYRDDGTL